MKNIFYPRPHFSIILRANFIFLIIFFASVSSSSGKDFIPVYDCEVVNSYPHDTSAFTEGLVYKDGFLYESTGLKGQSSLRKVNLKTGRIIKIIALEDKYFGEGIAVFGNKIVQLTENENTAFIYNLNSFKQLDSFYYPTWGWGITWNGENLIMSDGTSALYFLNPYTFKRVKKIKVHAGGLTLKNINELEYIKGKIYANIWHTEKIAVINPDSGKVTAWIDLSVLSSCGMPSGNEACLNGIAYDEENDRLFVTGKLWPKIFEIKIGSTPIYFKTLQGYPCR